MNATRLPTTYNGALSVGTSTTVVAAQNLNRGFLILQNRGATDADIAFGVPAVSGQGYLLAAGAAIGLDSNSVPGSAVNAIVASGTTTLFVLEG